MSVRTSVRFNRVRSRIIPCLLWFPTLLGVAAEPTHRDLEFAVVDGHSLRLDLYLPESEEKPPLIVWIHGGAWRSGSKERVPVTGLIEHGFAIASINYRLSPVARFPAQVHDIKAAIRFLRAEENRKKFGYGAEKVVIAGASAGGHLAALVGVTNGHEKLEGSVGEYEEESSDVAAIVDFYGPANFLTILPQSTPHGLSVRIPTLRLLLGAQPEDVVELATLASPVAHVDKTDPPILMIHGDRDPQVPINQSHELHGAYKEAGIPDKARLEVVHGGAHGGDDFYDQEQMKRVAQFLTESLKSLRQEFQIANPIE